LAPFDNAVSPTVVIVVALGLVASLALCAALLFERRRRRRAEVDARRYLSTMADLDRRAAMGQLAASLAHELTQPLSAILRNAEAARMLIDAGASPAELRDIVDDIRASDRRAAQIVQRMRALVQNHALAEEAVELNEVVRETMDVVAPNAASRVVRLQLALDKPAPVLVTGDRIHLQQVLLNLVLNGFDAMADTPEHERRLVVSTAARNGHVDLAVRDAGCGIDDDVLPRLFDPFFTTKRDGMGMGLSIVRSIVEAHHGRIEAANNGGRGATLRVSLPVRRHDGAATAPH
jgi:C4-dicarboxylate-specific signal transduction histidine kinase